MFRIYLSLLVRKEVISPSREAYLLCLLLHSLKTENLRSPFCQSRHAIHAFSGYIERSTPMSLAENSQNVSEDQILQRFGYRQEYKRELRRFASFAIGFSFISITTGIFTTYGAVLNWGGPLGIWTWPIVIVGQLLVALIFAALASRMPLAG